MWSCSNIFLAFFFIAFIIALILSLSIITQNECEIQRERQKVNGIRAKFLFAIAFALGFLVLIYQCMEKRMFVKALME
jgi:hypothetical protein